MSEKNRVARFERLDRIQGSGGLKAPVRTQEGFLRVDGRIARVGIQVYRKQDGSEFRELRLPEEVFDEESLASFRLVPVTNRHPPVLLTADNAKQYAIGALGQDVRKDGEWVAASMLLHDAAAIADAEAGRSQLSNGYTCELDPSQDPELAQKWGRYDAIQRRIRGNHCALVDSARAGPGAALRLDGDAACTLDFFDAVDPVLVSPEQLTKTENPKMPIKVKLDGGFEIEVNDANAEAAIRRTIEEARQDGLNKAKAEKERADKAELELAEERRKLSASQAELDTLKNKAKADGEGMVKCDECGASGKIDGVECKGCEGKGEFKKADALDPKRRADSLERMVERAAAARAKLLQVAQAELGANENFDGKSNLEIKKAVIKKLQPDVKLDGKDESYINHRFDFEVEALAKRPSPVAQARAAAAPVPAPGQTGQRADEKPSDPEAARKAMEARVLENNRKK